MNHFYNIFLKFGTYLNCYWCGNANDEGQMTICEATKRYKAITVPI